MKNYVGVHLPERAVDNRNREPIKWLRSRDVRAMLGISDSTLQTMRIQGTIPSYKLGSSWFYKEQEILAAIEAGKTSTRKEVSHG